MDCEDENGDWGVRPNNGLEVKLDEEQLKTLYETQRDRAIVPKGNQPHKLDGPRPDPVLLKALEVVKKMGR